MSGDLKERLDVLIRTEQTGSRLLMQLGIDALARIKELERPCASCTSDNPCSFGALARIAELEAQIKAAREAPADEAAFEAAWAMRPLDLNESSGKSRAWFWWQQALAALDPKPTATGETP